MLPSSAALPIRLRLLALLVLLCTGSVCASAQSGDVVITSNTTWATATYSVTSLTVESGATLTIGGGSTVNVSGAILVTGTSNIVLQSINNSALVGGSWQGAGVTLNAASIEVDSASSINADGQGYVPQAGPGAGASNNGGSYAGLGGNSPGSMIYGSANAPVDLGSGGGIYSGSGLPGGGAVRLIVSGTLTNNGIVSANGATVTGYVGGGAGGSVYVTSATLVGAGIFAANGGSNNTANGYGGGGGRIAVYSSSSAGYTGFTSATVNGGTSVAGSGLAGGAIGTIGFFDTSAPNYNLQIYQPFPIAASSTVTYNSITVQNGAVLTIGGGSTITVTTSVTVTGNSSLVLQSIDNSAQVNGVWAGVGVTLNAASVQVDAGSSLNADGQGYLPQAGPGAATSNSGGSYGGLGGGGNVGPIYGSATVPTDLGSGGGIYSGSGLPGGGLVRLVVSGTLTNNGVVSANGATVTGYVGGGSGGSVYITTHTLSGAGTFNANGGNNPSLNGFAGGGGRVAVYFYNAASFTAFTTSTAAGGTVAAGSGAVGTVGFFDTSVTNDNLDIYENYPIPANSTITFNSITVRNGAVLSIGGGSTINVTGQILVTGNSTIVLQSINNAAQVNSQWAGAGVTLNAASVEVDAGSTLNADGQGYVPQAGPGAATSNSGGSYGGLGGGTNIGPLYGSPNAPTDLGSGGGIYAGSSLPGGGAIRLIVSGTLLNNGIISAEGALVTGYVGGGSGGSIYVTTQTLSGAGTFNADGGSNNTTNGFGGGGGRVAIYFYNAATFTGFTTSTAAGGTVAPNGGTVGGSVGTVGFFDTSVTNDNLDVYQNFPIPATVTYNTINVRNGAVLTVSGGVTVNVVGQLLVTGKSTIVLQSIHNAAQVGGNWVGAGVTLNAASVQVDAGSGINADGQGYVQQAGPGAGASNSGGSYGGLGGGGNAGPIYGSPTAPTDLGSGGGIYAGTGLPGGGAIRLAVTGTLLNNGIISAEGAPVTGYVGGGSGGSVYVTTQTLSGAGTFNADGGGNNTTNGYGGGGGRVAVYFFTAANFTAFTTSTAAGGTVATGGGAVAGSPGTVGFFDTSVTNENLDVYQDYPIPANSIVTYNTITVRNGAVLTIGGGTTVNVTGQFLVTGDSTVLLQSINTSAQVNGKWAGAGVAINAASLEVDPGSDINADAQGYVALAGPGTSPTNYGGSYGGLGGGANPGPTYGSDTAPTDLGSGGGIYSGTGTPGGGAIQLTISGTLLNNGIISANAAPVTGYVGGSAGGSIYVITNALTGNGVFTANGGSNNTQNGFGGGGGRIAIYSASASGFTGFVTSTASAGTVVTGGGATAGSVGTAAFFDTSATNYNVGIYQNFVIPASSNIAYNSLVVNSGANLTIGGGAQLAVAQTMQVTGSVIALAIDNTAQVGGSYQGQGIAITAGNLQVDSTGTIDADAQGYVTQVGPGAGSSNSGGSYGGLGGGPGPGPTYGSLNMPVSLGSGGGIYSGNGTPGGGAIQLTVTGTLTNNGVISANAAPVTGYVGGSAGGSIYVTTATLAGAGAFHADGGSNNTNNGFGGGGGRVAIYSNKSSGFTGFAASTANGGSVVTGGSVVAGSPGTIAFFDTSVPNSNVSVYGNFVVPASTNVQYNSLTIANGATIEVGGGAQLIVAQTLHLTGTIYAQSINDSGPLNGTYQGQGVKITAGTLTIDATGAITADAQGYGPLQGPGAGPSGVANGGSYGGLGGGQSAATLYGSASAPLSLGSGGGQYANTATSGGGAIELLVSGTFTNNGSVSANALGVSGYAGGGSGGSLYIAANTLAGSGVFAANGGSNATNNGNGGGGGRIAVAAIDNSGFPVSSITAAGGTSGQTPGAAGTVTITNTPVSEWIQPVNSVIHGVATLSWFTDSGGATSVSLQGPQTYIVAQGGAAFSTATFDTTTVPDGAYELRLQILNGSGQVIQEIPKDEVINNSVAWHSGILTANQEWSAAQVHGVDGNVIVPAGITLTVDPGAVVKVLPGYQIVVQTGGTLIAVGSATAPVIFTTFDDYTVGGNTDFNQGISLPTSGEWNGVAVQNGGTFTSNGNTFIRYAQTTLSGTLSVNTTLLATQSYQISGIVTVPSGITLNLQPGTVLKMGANAGIDMQPGSTFSANGTLAQPIYITSVNDTSVGSNANTGNAITLPAPGDWNSILFDGATASLSFVQMQYGGGPLNSGNQAGMLETSEQANVTIANSTFAYSYAIGIQTGYPNGGGDTITLTDSTFYANEDRAINIYPGSVMHVVNDTFDGNAAGVFNHGGVADVENSVVTGSLSTQFGGIGVCCGGAFSNLSYNDVNGNAVNYIALTDPTGTLGNISAPAVYMNGPQHDYRPTYGSPLIDAANGKVVDYPLLDAYNDQRYNSPLVATKAGVPDVNGHYPDIGAYEFVSTAPSNIDFTVSNVQGPSSVIVGNQATVTWTVTNIGAGTAYGPWHDAIYLVTDPNTNPVASLAGQVLEGQGVVLGPGGTYSASGTVTVPGATVGEQRWQVVTNVRGEVFEGANTGNNTATAINPVQVDLTPVVVGGSPLAGAFSAVGQSIYYKITPNANQATTIQLALNAGVTGSVQLFVGLGYVPSTQQFDFQQTQFNSSTASLVIPAGSGQTYYLTAYAQTLSAVPAPFTLQASVSQFSLTGVTPNSSTGTGSSTLTFLGGGFTSGTTFQLVGTSGTTYSPTSIFLADADHAEATFALNTLPVGTYSATATNGSTVTLTNAFTITGSTVVVNPAGGYTNVQVTLDTPQALRAGFPALITLNYTNTSSYDVPAPVIWLQATGATLSKVAVPCAGCNANFTQMYQGVETSGLVLGIDNQGPAGVLPSGASGSVQFLATATGSSVSFSTETIDGVPDNLIGYRVVYGNLNGCTAAPAICDSIQNTGLYPNAAALCSAYTPPYYNAAGFTRTCMQLLAKSGFKTATCPYIGVGNCGTLDGNNIDQLIDQDATQLSSIGVYENDAVRLFAYEFQIDGVDTFNRRYHQGAFGYGPSHQFDIYAQTAGLGGAPVVFYPDGTARQFPVADPANASQYLGIPGDYGVLTLGTDSSATITEKDGTVYHFNAPVGNSAILKLGYIQDTNSNQINFTYSATTALLTSAVDSFGNTLSYAYDSLGHITKIADAVGRATTFTYDILSDAAKSTFLRTITDATGTTAIAWNEGGTHGVGYFDDSCATTFCEPAIGVTSVAYPNGTHLYYTYDALGRIATTSRDGGAQTVTYTYGPQGATTVTDGLGHATQILPNQFGVPGEIIDPLLNVTQYSYDSEQKNVAIQGALGTHTSIGYDSMGNLALLIDPLGNRQSFSSNAFGSIQSFTDANGNATALTYDAHNNLTGVAAPDGHGSQATYDAHGNMTSLTNARGHTIQFTYNANGLLASKTYANNTQVAFTYDAHNNPSTITAANGTTTYSYDSADRLTGVAYPNGQSIHYTYNAGGQPTGMTDSTGFGVQYGFDTPGRLATLTSGAGSAVASYTYDATGRVLKKTLGNGTYTAYTYDAYGNPLSLTNYTSAGAVIGKYSYTYDALNRESSMTAPSGSWTLSYDADSQITGDALAGTSIGAYTYDPAGNRLTSTGATYFVNNLDEYTYAAGNNYTYDADGNLTSGGGVTYTYDDENRLTGMTGATDSWIYVYDGIGERVSTTHNGTVTQYLNDPSGYGNVEAELNASNQVIGHYTYGLDLTSSVPASGSPAYYNFDASGNTVQMTNASQAVVNNYVYLPFGEKLSSTVGVANPFTYVGRYGVMDEGSGLYYMRNRFYSPGLGRFVQRDPIGLAGGTNLYAYAFNSPANLSDPLGTCPTGPASSTSQAPGSILGDQDATVNSHREAYDAAFGPGALAAHDAAIGVGSKQIVSVGVTVATAGLPDLPLAPNPAANFVINKYFDPLGTAANDALSPLTAAPQAPCPPTPPQKSNLIPVLKDMANFFSGGRLFANPPTNTVTDPVNHAVDPNGKLTSGYGSPGFVPAGAPITYTIFFENLPTATAPAVRVTITDQLPSNLDLSTLQFNQVAFNNVTLPVPSVVQKFAAQVKVLTDPNPVTVTVNLNPTTGLLTWLIQSIDPTTGTVPASPVAGFLPPNNAANDGAGSVTFTVTPKPGLANGTALTNIANIVFDVNAAITTNSVTNTLDTTTPTSAVSALPSSTTGTSFPVSWSGSDPSGSGISSYNIYVSINGGAYALWLSGTTLTTSTYTALPGSSYSFFSLATNNVGVSQTVAGTPQTIAVNYTTPVVTVTPTASSITSTQVLTVNIAVAGTPAPTGTIVLTSGTYTSTAVALAGGAAAIAIPAGALAAGTDTLTATYTPDVAGSQVYNIATGTAMVSVGSGVQTVSVNVGTTPSGAGFSVDGTSYTSAQTFLWTLGSTHTLATTSPQTAAGTQQTFTGWSDAGAISHTVTAASSTTSYTASFSSAFLLTTSASPAVGGTVTPASGTYYPAGTVVPLSATPAAGYTFSGWTGPVASSSSASTTVTLSAPQTVTANFSTVPSVTVSVGASPVGESFSVDGVNYTSTQSLTWVVGSTHTLAITSPQTAAGIQHTFTAWSDGGALSHTVTAVAATTSYTASFSSAYLLTIAANPAAGGTVTPATGTYYPAGAVVPVTATPASGYTFSGWTGPVASSTSASTSVTLSAPQTVTANFGIVTGPVIVSVGTSPAGQSFSVDGVSYTSTQSLSWTAGSSHTLATTSPQTAAGTQRSFAAWSDGGAISHIVTAASATTSYTASFSTAYLLTTSATPAAGGTVTPASGTYYAAGTVVPLTATPAAGYAFSGWTGAVASTSSASTTITLNAPQTVAAGFTLIPLPTVSVSPANLVLVTPLTSTSAAQTLQVTNTGTTSLIVSGITLGGANPAVFTQTNTCGASLAAGLSCAVSVTFTPTSVSTFAATVSIADNAANSPQTVTLTGIGTPAPSFLVSASPAVQSVVAGNPVSYAITLAPQGGGFLSPIALTATGLPSGATATFFPASVTPGTTAATSTLLIQTPAYIAAVERSPNPLLQSGKPVLALLGVLLLATRKRRRLFRLAVVAFLSLAAFTSLTGCASSKSFSTSTITIHATSGTQSQTTTVVLTLHI